MIEKESFPHEVLEITAWTEDGLVMAARHKIYRHLLVSFAFHFYLHSVWIEVTGSKGGGEYSFSYLAEGRGKEVTLASCYLCFSCLRVVLRCII